MIDAPPAPPIALIASPKVLAIKIKENHEPMVDLKELKDLKNPKKMPLCFGPSPEIPNNTDYTKLRKTVYTRLTQAQQLLPKGLQFCLYEGYRSLDLQEMLFDTRYKRVKKQHPEWSKDEVFEETTKLVSPVINADGSKNIPPHSTGAAIDVYLIDDKGEAVDMGIHPKDWMQDDDGSLSLTASTDISDEAKKYRRIMSHALESVGFTNYPTEYWHWSYGDRYWAFSKGMPYAIYSTYEGG